MTQPDPIVSFYRGGRDDRGRTLDEILGWSDDVLEGVHDYIQWLFPIDVPSGVNAGAPLVTNRTREAFERSNELRETLRRALDRMLMFYGLRRELTAEGVLVVIDQSRFGERSRTWLRPGNHNHLRLTRLMRCLWLLGLREEADALQRCLVHDICEGAGRDRISSVTLEFWRRALQR